MWVPSILCQDSVECLRLAKTGQIGEITLDGAGQDRGSDKTGQYKTGQGRMKQAGQGSMG